MLFGIKVFENKNGLKKVNEALNMYGSAIMFSGKNTGIFLTNPIEALKVALKLNKKNNSFKYKVYKLKDWEVSRVKEKFVVRTYKEYMKLANERAEETNKLLEKMLEEQKLSESKQETDKVLEK